MHFNFYLWLKTWVQLPRVQFCAIIFCLVCGLAMGTLINYTGEIGQLFYELDSFIIFIVGLLLVFPLSVPMFRFIKYLESRILDMIFEKGANLDYIEASTEQGLFYLNLYFKLLIYSGTGTLISGYWTNQQVAIIGASILLSGLLALIILQKFDKPVEKNNLKIRNCSVENPF